MNKLEKFGLATGIIGLFSDTIALTTFIGGFWGRTTTTVTAPYQGIPHINSVTTVREVPLVIATVIILTMIYSWLIISWVLSRRSFSLREIKNKEVVENIILRAIAGLGIITWPIFTMWLVVMLQTDVPTRVEANNLQATQVAVVALTPTPIPTPTPRPASDVTPTKAFNPPPSDGNGIWDKTDMAIIGILAGLPLQGIIGFILYWVLYALLPVVYPDMIEFGKPEPVAAKARVR